MSRHSERRLFPYSPEIFYTVVADVGQYPKFLPWVLNADVFNRTDQGFVVDLTIGYKFFQDTYRCEVLLTPNERIDIRYIKGPFKHLHNHWIFSCPAPNSVPNSVHVDFFIDFEFESTIFQGMIQAVFTDAVRKMISAFEERARVLSRGLPRDCPGITQGIECIKNLYPSKVNR